MYMNLIYKFQRRLAQKFSPWSTNYWDNRYRGGGDSGAGSYGELAIFKNQVISRFCKERDVKKIIEFGSGDGNQASLLPAGIQYTGLDVSKHAIALCMDRFKTDHNKRFMLFTGKKGFVRKHSLTAPVTMSLDVIYHLVEDSTFENYMHELFSASEEYVIIYSSNHIGEQEPQHVKHRKFTDYVGEHFKDFKLFRFIKNEYSPDNQREEQSFADFYIFEKFR